jgi:DNA-binding NarL/FixJ family response regulator
VGFTDEDAAVDYLTQNPIDLAVLDIKLKKRDGVSVLAEIKQVRPETKAIMLTGYPTHETASESTRLGADAYCIKPIDRRDLEAKVTEVLEGGRSGD